MEDDVENRMIAITEITALFGSQGCETSYCVELFSIKGMV